MASLSSRLKIAFLTLAVLASPLVGTITPARADSSNLIPNPSVETPGTPSTMPDSWQTGSWGSNNAAFTYDAAAAQDGSHSLRVDITSYTSGDAKWYFNPVTVTPGATYIYSDYYISNVTTEIVAQTTKADGSNAYVDLGPVAPASTWTQETVSFATPATAVQVTFFHLISSIGSLQTDNFSLTPPSGGTIINGVPNAGLEENTNGTTPLSWSNASWGTNTTTFTYLTTGGHASTHAVKTDVTAYTSGDAKWYYDAQPIIPGKTYQLSDYYKSTIVTQVVAAIGLSDGTTQYLNLADAPAATGWKQYTATLKAPATAQNVTMFHLVSAVGSLTTDDYALKVVQPQDPIITNGVPNASAEQTIDGVTPLAPLAWSTQGWGTNTATFTYLKTGHTGTKSLKVQMTAWTSGDAKWSYPAQPAIPGQYYQVSDYYKANVDTQVIVQITMADGSTQYVYLKQALKSASVWKQYVDYFTAPVGAQTMTVFHVLAAVGTLTTDDYSVIPMTPGKFNRALVSVNFDDGWESIYTNALPLLIKYQIPSTQFIISGYLTNAPGYMSQTEVQAFKNAGSEIGSHTVDHADLTTLTAAQLKKELAQSQSTLEQFFGGPINDFASPYGAYNTNVITAIKKYYRSHRSTDMGFNSKDSFDVYNIKVQDISVTTTPAQVQTWIDQALAAKTWLVLVYHQVDLSGDTYSVTPQNLDTELQEIKDSGITAVTNGQAIDEITPQL